MSSKNRSKFPSRRAPKLLILELSKISINPKRQNSQISHIISPYRKLNLSTSRSATRNSKRNLFNNKTIINPTTNNLSKDTSLKQCKGIFKNKGIRGEICKSRLKNCL